MKSKKIMALFLSAIIIALTFSIIPAVEVSAATTQWEYITPTTSYEEVVLSYNDYETASIVAIGVDGRWQYKKASVSGNAFPTNNLNTKAMRFTQVNYSISLVMPGNDFSDSNCINVYKNPIEVKPGMQLNIEFDYKVELNVINKTADGTDDWYDSLNSALEIGYTLLPDQETVVATTTSDPVTYNYATLVNNAEALHDEFVTVANGHNTEIDWTHVSKTVNIPETAVLETYKYLSLYISGGYRSAIYIDNVKVTTFVENSTKTSFQDYENAKLVSGVLDTSPYNQHGSYNQKSFGNIAPRSTADITNEAITKGHGKVLEQRGNISLNFLGYDFSVQNPTEEQLIAGGAIPAKAGTYKITFDYFATSTLSSSTVLKLHVGTGKLRNDVLTPTDGSTATAYNSIQQSNYLPGTGSYSIDNVSQHAFSQAQLVVEHPQNTPAFTEWKTVTTTLTIDNDKDGEFLILSTSAAGTTHTQPLFAELCLTI